MDKYKIYAKLNRFFEFIGAIPPKEEPESTAAYEAMKCLEALIPYPDDFNKCITSCVKAQSSRQTRIHAAYWTLRKVEE